MDIALPFPHRRGFSAFWLLLLVSVLLGTLLSGVRAANFVVNNNMDSPIALPGVLTLRQAIDASNTTAGSNTITFDPTVFATPQAILLIQGELTISSDVTITGPGANILTIDGGASGSNNLSFSRVFNIAASTTVGISGLTIDNGNCSSNNDSPGYGGGIYNSGALTLTNCTVTNNTADTASVSSPFAYGGGIFSNGSLTLIGSTVTGNTATASAAGPNSALSEGGGILSNGTVSLQNSTVSNNTCTANNNSNTATGTVTSFGGGIYQFDQPFTGVNSTISGNFAGGSNPNGTTDFEGGGIYELGSLMTLTNCIVGGPGQDDGNSASLGGGVVFNAQLLTKGASVKKSLLCGLDRPSISLPQQPLPTLTGCTVEGNTATQGAGLYLTTAAQAMLSQDQILNNRAFASGGGIYDAAGTLTVDQTTLSGNIAGAPFAQLGGFTITGLAGYGGGIYNEQGTETITNTTFSANQATAGGGLFVTDFGSDHVGNTTFVNNTATLGSNNNVQFPGDGGAIANNNSMVFLTNCTVSGNTAVHGGGLYYNGPSLLTKSTTPDRINDVRRPSLVTCQSVSTSTFTVTSSLIAQNVLNATTAAGGVDIYVRPNGSPFTTGGSNIIGIDDSTSANTSGFTNGVSADQVGSAAAPINPQIGPLQNNGGPTQTKALLAGSPAIDADFNGPNGQSSGDGVFQDQRGVTRPQGVRNDIGAFEFALPVAVNDAYGDPENTTLTVPAPGVLANDTAPVAGDTLTAVNGTQPAHGTVVLNADGSFSYKPTNNFVGTDTFTYQAQDTTQNPALTSNTATVTITINDTTPPTTTASLAGTKGNGTFYRGPVTVTLSATDPDNTPAQITTLYTTDGTDPKISATATSVTGGPVTLPAISGDGAHTVRFFSKDPTGNTETPTKAITFTIDTTPPHTTVTPSGTVGKNGYFVGPVSLTFASSDAISGVATTTYTLDSGTAQTYTATATNYSAVLLTVSTDGLHTLTFSSTDRAGNIEATGTVSFSIDTTPPVTTASLSGQQAASTSPAAKRAQAVSTTYTGPVTVTLAATDNLSGIAVTTYSVDNGPIQVYTKPFVISTAGTHTLTFGSTDKAGNVETPHSQSFTINNTPAKPAILHAFPTGLYLFSVPKDMSGIPLSQVFDQPGIKLAVWLPLLTQYVLTPTPPADALRPGQGYWARFAQNTNLYDLGTPTPTNAPFAIPIQVGWNMIGDPFPSSAPSSSLRVQTSTGTFTMNDPVAKILLAPTFYSYDTPSGQYQGHALQSDSLVPYVGYWLYSRCTGNLVVNVP